MISEIIIGINKIGESLVAALISAVAYYIIRKLCGKGTSVSQIIAAFCFAAYCVAVGKITGIFEFSNIDLQFNLSCNLVPFANESFKLIVLNFLMFVPFGVLMPVVFGIKKFNYAKVIIITAAVVVCIELLQMLLFGRLADIDDVIADTLGSIAGYTLLRAIVRVNAVGSIGKNRRLLVSALILAAAAIWSIQIHYISAGDVMLMSFGISPWVGMDSHINALEGLRITGLIGLVATAVSIWIAAKERKSDARKSAQLIVAAGICLAVYIILSIVLSVK